MQESIETEWIDNNSPNLEGIHWLRFFIKNTNINAKNMKHEKILLLKYDSKRKNIYELWLKFSET